MLDSEEYRELRNGKRFYISIERTMSDNSSIEENATGSSSENVQGKVSEIQALTKDGINEQTRGFIASLTHQTEELTRLVQGMVTTQHPHHYDRTDFGTTSGTAIYKSDNLLLNSESTFTSFFPYLVFNIFSAESCVFIQKDAF